jgi:ferredoxin-type protein NapH
VSTAKTSSEFGVQGSERHSTSYSLDKRGIKLSRLRRFVMLGIIVLFILQFFRIKILVGGLTGSLAIWSLNLIDIFAYMESFAASKSFTIQAMFAVVPVIVIYLIFGRAFCGWACPMDFLFELINKRRDTGQGAGVGDSALTKRGTGYVIAGGFLILSALFGVPFFTRYLSHLTNFFSFVNAGVYMALNLPVSKTVLIFSGAVISLLSAVEYLFPRLWCRVLCPVGKTYGLFNKVSLLKLSFAEGECGECNLCEEVCYMDVKITHHLDQPGLRDTNCIYCGRCAEGCGTKGKLIKMNFRTRR